MRFKGGRIGTWLPCCALAVLCPLALVYAMSPSGVSTARGETAGQSNRWTDTGEPRSSATDAAQGTTERELEDSLTMALESERRDGFSAGMGLRQSLLFEEAGDDTGAVLAAFKELLYARAKGLAADVDLLSGLAKLENSPTSSPAAKAASGAARDFVMQRWDSVIDSAADMATGRESDSLARWMVLVSEMERAVPAPEAIRTSYAGLQARYAGFPEYWYRSARMEPLPALARDSAERCIGLAPVGPFTAECRSIIARSYGLDPEAGAALLTVPEIQAVASRAAKSADWSALTALFPLLSLPDNPVSLYALGIFRALAVSESARDWLLIEAKKARGRLAERLAYVAGS